MLALLYRQLKYFFTNKNQNSILLGTLFEHFDASLYGFMAPFLAPLFFPNYDPVSGMILMFSTYPITYLSKPFGAYIIGQIGDKYGRKRALLISMIGMGGATLLMGLLPTYETVGIYAPVFLLLTRMAQVFFLSGESNGGPIFMLEHSKTGYLGRASGFYCTFTGLGIFLGSFTSAVIMKAGIEYWRVPYFFGFITAICAVYLRYKTSETPAFKNAADLKDDKLPVRKLINLIAISAFARILYMVPSVLIVTFIPLATNIPTSQILYLNTLSLLIYTISLPFMGILTDRLTPKVMLSLSIKLAVFLAYPLFCLFYYKNIYLMFFSKVVIILITAAFYCALHPWYISQFMVKQRYKYVSLGYAIGAQIGASSPAISMAIYKKTGLISSYTLLIIIFGCLSLFLNKFKTKEL
ncbi:MFS transporter [Rickettsiales endosymbiont of Stachyamoeba lipophora]|uniref:MFS transporter n=1 Tax=Rickettsiales endosymbiont of Stachyamoeba lipophora TaxID=2486578 RepID=UPI000F64711F|nr:MFS transporter [Rickettsiales endosymbiont of Stachyamoeba lipophora]AZL15583.1 MFS transporter [Rickettsiales endosymbiont of Stachyamoeba lipophora]